MTCDRCGGELVVGSFPFCKGNPSDHGRGVNGVTQDEFIGGLTLENLGPEPVTVYSRSELRRELNARKLEPMVRHVEGDQHVRSWTTMDPQTMANAVALAERQAHTKATNNAEEPVEVTSWIRDGEAFEVSL